MSLYRSEKTHAFYMPRQTTPYTCGAACLAAVARLLGHSFSESEIAKACNARPGVGIENDAMREWALRNLPGAGETEGTYPSIWNIRNPISGVGHYVVVLGNRAGRVRYYDPLYCRVLEFPLATIDWQSGCGRYKQWRLDFSVVEDYFDASFIGEQHGNTPSGEPIAEIALGSLKRYLDNNSPVRTTHCPLGGLCACEPHEKCESR